MPGTATIGSPGNIYPAFGEDQDLFGAQNLRSSIVPSPNEQIGTEHGRVLGGALKIRITMGSMQSLLTMNLLSTLHISIVVFCWSLFLHGSVNL